MSADNGIYIACFPDGTYRVAHGFDSVINDLETHHASPETYMELVEEIWGGNTPVFNEEDLAVIHAGVLLSNEDYTEYGICRVSLPVNFGEMKEPTPEPMLTEGACKFCSTAGSREVFHGDSPNWRDMCQDPTTANNILKSALREHCGGVNEGFVARIALEALRGADLIKEGS